MLKFPEHSAPLVLPTIALLGTLAACATLTPTAGTRTIAPPAATACAAFARISYSRLHDTAETIRQVKAYDAARDALCGKGK